MSHARVPRPLLAAAFAAWLATPGCSDPRGANTPPAPAPVPPTKVVPGTAPRLKVSGPDSVTVDSGLAVEVVDVFNAKRKEANLDPLPLDPDLQELAKAQVKAIFDLRPPTRGSRGGNTEMPSVAKQAAEAGYHFRALEAITSKLPAPIQSLADAWMAEPKNPYRRMILGDWAAIGCAQAVDSTGAQYVSVIFGTPEADRGTDGGTGAAADSGGPAGASTGPSPKEKKDID